MKRILKKAGILLLVFLLGTAGTALLLNSESTDNRSDFNDAVFPEVMVDMNDTLINRMYGYAQPMQADFTRDSVTPLDTSKTLSFVINPYDAEVSSFSYEIRTSDGSKVLENKKIKNLEKDCDFKHSMSAFGRRCTVVRAATRLDTEMQSLGTGNNFSV